MAIRMFRLLDTRGARAEDHRHAVRAIALSGLCRGLDEPVLLEPEEREPFLEPRDTRKLKS